MRTSAQAVRRRDPTGGKMTDEREARPTLPNLALPPDPDLALPDLVGTGRPPVRPADDYRAGGPPRRVQPPVRERDEDRPLPPLVQALTLALPNAVVALVAVIPTAVVDLLPLDALPFALLLMIGSQAVGWWIGRAAEATPLARICLMNLATLGVVLPFLALQASAGRTPYVSTEFGTATAAILATVAAVAAMICASLFAVGLARDAPEQASLLFAPVALLVPELLGAPFQPEASEIVRRLFEVYALAAAGAFMSVLVPRIGKALVTPASLGLLFIGLWVVGRGPTLQRTSGDVVRVLDAALLATTVLLAVAVPIIAMGVRRVMWEMRAGWER